MLLWVFVTAVFSGVVIYQNRYRYRDMMPYVVAVLMLNLAFFLALNLFLSNPFNQLVQVNADGSMQKFIPPDGRGLNPLLQYWAMVIHPPILYLGFIGFVVPFAFAIAALITRQLGDTWIRTTRRWTLLTWLFLGVGSDPGRQMGLRGTGLGRLLGMGSGGKLLADALADRDGIPALRDHPGTQGNAEGLEHDPGDDHLSARGLRHLHHPQRRRQFGARLRGLPAGRVLSRLHGLVAAGSLYLIIDRLPYLKSERPLDSVLSRESAFLFNNLILVVACFAVLWGTMFPVLSEWLQGTKITVGPPFFNNVNIPIGLFLLFLTGVGPLFAWRKTSVESLKKAFFWPASCRSRRCAASAGLRDAQLLCGDLLSRCACSSP